MEELAQIGMSGMAGGLTGVLASLTGRVFSFFERRQANAFAQQKWENDVKLRQHERSMAELKHDHLLQLHEANRKGVQEEHERALRLTEIEVSGAGLTASLEDQKALNQFGGKTWADYIIKLMRPLLTLVALCMLFSLSKSDKVDPIMIASVFAYLAVASFLWWFGDRVQDKMQSAIFGKLQS